jgi:hypothetical protein
MVKKQEDKGAQIQKKVNKNKEKDEKGSKDNKDKDKKRKDSSDGSDDGEYNHRSFKLDKNIAGKNLVEILRDDEGIKIVTNQENDRNFDWAYQIETVWEFIKKCNVNMDDCKKLAARYIFDLKVTHNKFKCPGKIYESEEKKDMRIINRKTMEPLLKRLEDTNHISHSFIVQYIVKGCCKHFEDEDKLKKYLINKHDCSDLIVRNYMIYTLSQLYHKEFAWWTKKNEMKEFLKISNYWKLKGTCIIERCEFGNKHDSLNSEREHVKEYFENVLNMKYMSHEQVTIFLALSPVWKMIIIERAFDEIGWK